jgi:hypothetical protein
MCFRTPRRRSAPIRLVRRQGRCVVAIEHDLVEASRVVPGHAVDDDNFQLALAEDIETRSQINPAKVCA